MCLYGDLMSLETKVFTSSWEVPVIFARIGPRLVFLEKFHWKSPIWNFTEIRPVGATLLPADRQADEQNESSTRFKQLRQSA
jgi:hypothetical protein